MAPAKKPLLLVGMMGTGKTTLGKMLADKLDLTFADSDALIVKQEGKTIPEVFADETQGEAYFRQVESDLIIDLIEKNTYDIIATGGGAVITQKTMDIAQEKAYVVWIKSAPEHIYARIKNDANRPLLQVEDPCQALRDILASRIECYNRAHTSVDLDDGNPLHTLDEITNIYNSI